MCLSAEDEETPAARGPGVLSVKAPFMLTCAARDTAARREQNDLVAARRAADVDRALQQVAAIRAGRALGDRPVVLPLAPTTAARGRGGTRGRTPWRVGPEPRLDARLLRARRVARGSATTRSPRRSRESRDAGGKTISRLSESGWRWSAGPLPTKVSQGARYTIARRWSTVAPLSATTTQSRTRRWLRLRPAAWDRKSPRATRARAATPRAGRT